MRLQKLQISGFKSFSDRSELSFDRGVTAIVGPNGCGKSNVADAIVWVLGEQSAKSLRGDQMMDVIFNGSEARKPTAAAEVRLMLSEVTSASRLLAEEQEDREALARNVEVTRRLYRSGDSEYLINGEQCRLRDVHELLMDTGLGAKAYAIIEQGKIGQILSSRPTDRRQLIEEAAGVTKYKARRRAAELKLEASQQNLTRIDDIIFEVEKQRAALKRQAAKARRYRRLREELRRWEKVLFARRYRVLAAAIEAARGRLSARRAEEAAAAARLAGAEEALSRTRLELARAEADAAAQREAAHARELEIDRRQTQISLNQQQLEHLVTRRADVAEELLAIAARHEPARHVLEERREAAARAAAERDEAGEVLARANGEHAEASRVAHSLEAEIDERRQALYVLQSSIASLQHAVENARASRERVGDDLARLQSEQADVQTEESRLADERASVRARLAEAGNAIERLQAAAEARRGELATVREGLERERRETRSREQELASVEARLRSLEELEAARAEYGEAARLVLSGSVSIPHRGSLADCLEVERGYERAVEGYLGDRLQHVLVDDHATAERGLAAVREHRAGRCGFLVLGGADGAIEEPAAPPVEGLEALTSVVRITGPRGPVAGAMGRAWLARSFAAAAAASARTNDPIVTREGDVFTGPHLVYGGAREEARGILSTKGEIKELRDRSDQVRGQLDTLAERTEAAEAAIAALTSSIAALEADGHSQEKVIVGLEAQQAKVAENAERLSRRTELLRTEVARAEEQRRALEAREHEAALEIDRRQADRVAADQLLATGQRTLQGARETAESVAGRVADARALHATLVERAAALVTEVARLDEALAELASREAARREEASQNEARQAELRVAIDDGTRQLDEDAAELERLREGVRQADESLAAQHAAADQQEGEIRTARTALDDLRAALAELDVARATAEGDLAHLAATCLEAVQATLDAVVAEVEQAERDGQAAPAAVSAETVETEETEDEGQAAAGEEQVEGQLEGPAPDAAPARAAEPATPEEAIASLRERIDRLGPVNMMAIEQFDELEGRHIFLTTQRQDLRESIAATGEAIRRIDETSKERFREAFVVINENFQETFSTLFGGGRAGLALVNDADVLESGIEIVAQPPGKRLQSVQLLSGGEKALTAIALMFAIFRYKPSPFCVLDEIDAPLDDANIGRFVELLKQMQDQTQFIIITHSRKTMEIADRLYGVTMEEPGVSKLISVRLN